MHRPLPPLTPIHRQLTLAVCMGLATLAFAPSPAVAQQIAADLQQARPYSIPAGALTTTLNRFAGQAGIYLAAPGELTAGKQSPGLSGTYTVPQALDQLLTGNELNWRIEGNQLSLQRRSSVADAVTTPTESSSTSTLPTMYVQGTYLARNSTATGLNLDLRETPQSVSVITPAMMEDRRIENLADIVEHTIGLSISRYESNRGSMFSRGSKIESYLIDGVPTTIDEQWSAGEILSNTAIYDRAEVLRGSDGLMVGTGSPSAVINLIRKKADSREFGGKVAAEYGSWNTRGLNLDLSAPLSSSGSTRMRVAADYKEGDSHIDRLRNRTHVVYATVEQDIGDNTLIAAGISQQDNRTDSPSWGGAPAWMLGSDDQISRITGLHRGLNTSPDWSYWDSSYRNWFIDAEHRFNSNWKASARFSRGQRESESRLALFYPYPIDPTNGKSVMAFQLMPGVVFKYPVPGYAGVYWVDSDKDAASARLDGTFELFGRKHDVLVGYDHWKERVVADGAPGTVTIDTTPNVFDYQGSAPLPTFIARQNYNNRRVTQDALYAVGRLTLSDPLKLILGARVIDYKVEDLKTPANSYAVDNEVVPYAGLVFDINRHLATYASYTSIFQPQNYRNAGNRLLSPIEGNTYEVGLKSAFLNGRLSANLAVFRMQQENVAKYAGLVPEDPANPTGPMRSSYTGIDGTVSRGFEFEVVGEILDGWQLSSGYSRFKAEQADGSDVSPVIPRKQFNLFTSYRFPGTLQGLTLGGGVRWQSQTFSWQPTAQALGIPALRQSSYSIVDLMARYQLNEQWSAQLNIGNVLDEKYFAPTEDGMQLFWQAPRNATLSVRYTF
ncbi:MAG: TonB-dependent siderophore receptor [Pseudoxanthomonas mexicana]|nr:TonB-dependent siderophore receptor [Pseudoxanthomonas mexicana]